MRLCSGCCGHLYVPWREKVYIWLERTHLYLYSFVTKNKVEENSDKPLYEYYLEIFNQQIQINNLQYSDNMFSVSFKELMFGDYDELVTKLENITSIPASKLNKELLEEWRTKSLSTAEAVLPTLKEFYERNTYIS